MSISFHVGVHFLEFEGFYIIEKVYSEFLGV